MTTKQVISILYCNISVETMNYHLRSLLYTSDIDSLLLGRIVKMKLYMNHDNFVNDITMINIDDRESTVVKMQGAINIYNMVVLNPFSKCYTNMTRLNGSPSTTIMIVRDRMITWTTEEEEGCKDIYTLNKISNEWWRGTYAITDDDEDIEFKREIHAFNVNNEIINVSHLNIGEPYEYITVQGDEGSLVYKRRKGSYIEGIANSNMYYVLEKMKKLYIM